MKDRQPAYLPPDYMPGRTLALENHINQAFAATFRPDNPAAMLVLDYLKQSFLHTILGPGETDAALRHREGQRDLVRIMQMRIDHGRSNAPAAPAAPAAR